MAIVEDLGDLDSSASVVAAAARRDGDGAQEVRSSLKSMPARR